MYVVLYYLKIPDILRFMRDAKQRFIAKNKKKRRNLNIFFCHRRLQLDIVFEPCMDFTN